jgi:hypothetical protein
MAQFRRVLILSGLAILLLLTATTSFAATYSFSGNIASGAQYDLYPIQLTAGDLVVATLICDEFPPPPGNRPLDPVLSVFFPGVDTSDTLFANVYNDDGFGLDDDPSGVNCNAFDSSRVQFTAPSTGTYTFRADGFGSSTGPYTLRISATGTVNPLRADGRVNPQQDAPLVLYCNGTSTDVYSVSGVFLGSVPPGGTAALGGGEFAPTPDGRMSVIAGLPDGKSYLLVWSGCPHGSYEAYTVQGGVPTRYDIGTY